jgi:hypothetical protein
VGEVVKIIVLSVGKSNSFLMKTLLIERMTIMIYVNRCARLCYGILISILDLYRSNVEGDSIALFIVPRPMSNSNRHVIFTVFCVGFS